MTKIEVINQINDSVFNVEYPNMIITKRVKKIIYYSKEKYWLINDRFEIDKGGCVWWSWIYIGKRGDFPQYIFDVAKKLIKQLKNKYTVEIMPKDESPFRCKFEWDKVNDL